MSLGVQHCTALYNIVQHCMGSWPARSRVALCCCHQLISCIGQLHIMSSSNTSQDLLCNQPTGLQCDNNNRHNIIQPRLVQASP